MQGSGKRCKGTKNDAKARCKIKTGVRQHAWGWQYALGAIKHGKRRKETFTKHLIHDKQKAKACIGIKDKTQQKESMQLKRALASLSMVAIGARHL